MWVTGLRPDLNTAQAIARLATALLAIGPACLLGLYLPTALTTKPVYTAINIAKQSTPHIVFII